MGKHKREREEAKVRFKKAGVVTDEKDKDLDTKTISDQLDRLESERPGLPERRYETSGRSRVPGGRERQGHGRLSCRILVR